MSKDHSPIEQSGLRAMEEQKRRQAEERRKQEAKAPKHISPVMAEAAIRLADVIDKKANPTRRKHDLAIYIRSRVDCPHSHHVMAERAAEYVIFHGFPEELMGTLLDELDEAEEKKKVKPYIEGDGGGRGQWFYGVLNKRVDTLGIPRIRNKGQRP